MYNPSFKLKAQLLASALILLVVACGPQVNKEELEKAVNFKLPTNTVGVSDTLVELTTTQQAALDALDELQVSGDGSNRLYGTFANHYHPFYPPDTNFVISQEELLMALSSFLKVHYSSLSAEDRTCSRGLAVRVYIPLIFNDILYPVNTLLNPNTLHNSSLPLLSVK